MHVCSRKKTRKVNTRLFMLLRKKIKFKHKKNLRKRWTKLENRPTRISSFTSDENISLTFDAIKGSISTVVLLSYFCH